MNRSRVLLFAAVLLCSFARRGWADLREVRFEDELLASGPGPVVVVQVPDDAVLVFDNGPYYLDGADLLVYAPRAIVRGDVTIASWDPTVNKPSPPGVPSAPPAPSGCGGTRCTGHGGSPGNRGNVGESGDPGTLLYLEIDDFTAEAGAKLEVAASGQMGGKGQHGGAGGPGGSGGSGENGSDDNFCARPCPTTGGSGGRGGRGGPGGAGGTGGKGGVVKLSPELWALHQGGAAELGASAPGGVGGPAGDPGLPGPGGPGGPRGAGARACICRNPPGPGPNGGTGPSGTDPPDSSKPGNDGAVEEIQ